MELRQCDFFCLKRFYHNAPAGKQTQKDQQGEKPASVQKDYTFNEFYDLMFLLIMSLGEEYTCACYTIERYNLSHDFDSGIIYMAYQSTNTTFEDVQC